MTKIVVTEQPINVTAQEDIIAVIEVQSIIAGGAGGSGEDANYQQSFTFQDTIVVTHNLHKYPAVTIIDTAGDEVEAAVDHNSTNQLTVTLSAQTSGVIICN